MSIKYDNTKGFELLETEVIGDPFKSEPKVTGIEQYYGVEHPVIYIIGAIILFLTLIPGGVIVWHVLIKSLF